MKRATRATPIALALVLAAGALGGCGGGGQVAVGVDHTGPVAAPKAPATLTASSAGPGDPAATAILSPPTGAHAGTPRGVVMLIHGGAWKGIDPAAVRQVQALSGVYTRRGWETLIVDYGHAAQSVRDVVDFFDQTRKLFPGLPFCASGTSAGGHLALMLAALRPSLRCAVSLAGPTDLVSAKQQPGGALLYQTAVSLFGAAAIARLSPALLVRQIRAKLLLMYATNDTLVPVSQGEEMAHAAARTALAARLITFPPGPAGFVHSGIATAAAASVVPTELKFIARAFAHAPAHAS